MFKVSSLIHRHQSYVVDVGSPKKQVEWLNKMHSLIRMVIEQAKKGRLMSLPANAPPAKPPPVNSVSVWGGATAAWSAEQSGRLIRVEMTA
jgi:hypothetical protein